jgi:hypothetical protein
MATKHGKEPARIRHGDRKRGEILAAALDVSTAEGLELHAYVQEANWAPQALDDRDAFEKARKAIEQVLAEAGATAPVRRRPTAAKRRLASAPRAVSSPS